MTLKMISKSEYQREAIAMGYNVHGANESGQVEVPDLTLYMPEIADEFTGYLRDFLPRIPGFDPEFMSEERVEGIIAEVKDHLLDTPPNMAGVMDIGKQLNLDEKVMDQMMDAMKDYFEHLIEKILEDMGYPYDQRHQAAASMAYALGTLSDREYMEAIGGAFGGQGDNQAL
jgi:hypothetical protein